MHIHIHNPPEAFDQPITLADWEQAGIHGHHLTVGETVEDFLRAAPSVNVLIAQPWELSALDLFAAPRLELVQFGSAGLDALYPFDMIPEHVKILNNRGAHGQKGGEYALMAILLLTNLIPRFLAAQREQTWQRIICPTARAKRLTIVGLGTLGGAAAAQARHLGMHVTGLSRSGRADQNCDVSRPIASLDTVLPTTDILLLACPLTPETDNLISAPRLEKLPLGAGLINIGRGGLIDETALFDALDGSKLGGAVLDVFRTEPLPPGHRAWTTRNLIVTPHMAADDPLEYNNLTLQIFKKNLESHLAGQIPPTSVDRVKGY